MMSKRSLNINLTILCAVFFLCVVVISSSAHAANKGDIFTRFKKPLPEITLLSDEAFLKATKPVRKKPYGSDVLEFSLRIPKDWTEREDKGSSNFLLSEKLFLDLSVFYGRPTAFGRSRLEIQALGIDSNLTAEQWYLEYILKGGNTPEGLVTHSDTRVESFMIFMDSSFSYYVRTLILMNGDKVVMAKYFVPVDQMKEQGVMQAQVIKSFSLLNIVPKTHMEMEKYRFLDIAELMYPPNWKVFANPLRDINRMSITVMNLKEVAGKLGRPASMATEGKLDVTVVSAAQNSLIEEVQIYKQKIQESGMIIGEKLETKDDYTYEENIDFAMTEVYDGIDSAHNTSEYEFWFTVLVGGNYYYFFTLLTPSRNERFGLWADNTQNYKEIMRQFRPMAGAFLERD